MFSGIHRLLGLSFDAASTASLQLGRSSGAMKKDLREAARSILKSDGRYAG